MLSVLFCCLTAPSSEGCPRRSILLLLFLLLLWVPPGCRALAGIPSSLTCPARYPRGPFVPLGVSWGLSQQHLTVPRARQCSDIPAANTRAHVGFKLTGLLFAVLYFWGKFLLHVPVVPELFLLIRTSSYWCTFMFIGSFFCGSMIRKDNFDPGLKFCCSVWTNNYILMTPDKRLALGFGKELLKIVWTVHFIWASAIKNYLYPPKRTNSKYLYCWDKSSGSAVTGQGAVISD